jgi:two-component system OmpR family response regulator
MIDADVLWLLFCTSAGHNSMQTATVLVVDDDPDSRALLELALSFEGYEVVSAADGKAALTSAKQHHPDVILLDLAMPIMDGFGFRAAQLRDPSIAVIPVICVSGRHDANEATRKLNLAGCVGKPFSLDEIVFRVRDVIGRSGSSDPSTRSGGPACR